MSRRFCETFRARARGKRGGAAVLEMTFVMSLLLLLSFGMVEFGHFFYIKHNLQAAAREGARAGIVPSATNQNVIDAVTASMQLAGLSPAQFTVQITNTATPPVPIDVATATPGTSVKVTVSCTWGTVGVRPMAIMPANRSVVGATVMRKEG
jgi:Flp pilus assembly protein TadG